MASTYKQWRIKYHKPCISIFILVWLCFSSLLINRHYLHHLFKPVRPALAYWGFLYSFAVFPGGYIPKDKQVVAVITFDDGTTATWQYLLYLDNVTYLQQFIDWRFRKLIYTYLDNTKSKRNNILCPDFARYVARLNDTSNNHPVSVRFIEYSKTIPPPGAPNTVAPISNRTLFIYHVRSGELQ
jgi:hypothetical protein